MRLGLLRRHPDSFGGRYLPEQAMPARGAPWILPPTRGVAEIARCFREACGVRP